MNTTINTNDTTIDAIMAMVDAPAPTPETTTKECSHCYSVISIKASRCPNCTSELD